MHEQRKVLGRRHDLPQFLDVVVEIGVIDPVEGRASDEIVQLPAGHDHSREPVGLARHTHFEDVVVPVAERIVAFPEQDLVLFVAQHSGVQTMRGRK